MIRAGRHVRVAGLLSGLGWFAAGAAAGDRSQTPEVRVWVVNNARVDENTLSIALDRTGEIFRGAGLRLTFLRCDRRAGAPACRFDETGLLIVRIASRAPARFGDLKALGFAIVTKENSTYATIFWDRVLAVTARRDSCPDAVLLGHAVAHELGHLLLGDPAHAPYGLMSGHWRGVDLDRASAGILGFSTPEAARIRAEAIRRLGSADLAGRSVRLRP